LFIALFCFFIAAADARVAICESASRAPYRPPHLSDEDNEEGSSALRVAACVVGGQSAPTVLSMVNEHGDLIDCLQLHAIQLRVPLSPPDLVASVQQRRAADQSLLNAFLRTHRPRAVVVGTSSHPSVCLHRDQRVIFTCCLLQLPRPALTALVPIAPP
jgi:hypothetical protein